MKRPVLKALKILLTTFLLLAVGLVILFYSVSSPPAIPAQLNAVNDVTQLNPVDVREIFSPISIEEIISKVKGSDIVSIGGAKHSMGGQIATENSVHLDMRRFDKVTSFSEEEKEITVQSGITWLKIQQYIDPYNLSVSIMQTYANFTVGGSLSVNAHGRYIGQGPMIHSVKSIKVVLADGGLIECSPENNSEIFFGVIGGYGGLGVIVEATLKLTDNVKVARNDSLMSIGDYPMYFAANVRNDTSIIFHNADIYPNEYNMVRAVSYIQTANDLTTTDRIIPENKNYRLERFAMWMVSEAYGGKWLRQHVFDALVYGQDKVVWRNYEASYDAMELEPHSRKDYTYVLQEYFIPVSQFDSFVPAMARILEDHQPNIINISIRHARKDKGSLLAWANEEVFCFVVYYKQGTKQKDKEQVARWTVKLIDEAIKNGGSYYIPYQLHASSEQFLHAYPHAMEFFGLKKRLDPTNKFRNKLWDKYYKSGA